MTAAVAAGLCAARADDGGILSEIRGGVLLHDRGPTTAHEESGIDMNIELLFDSPAFLAPIGAPRPHIGADINTFGNTSDAYVGLSWQWDIRDGWFAGFSAGGAVHDGKTLTNRTDRKELGCRFLFRGSVEGGYHLDAHSSISLFLDHISNGRLCDENEGLENFGIRYGYRF